MLHFGDFLLALTVSLWTFAAPVSVSLWTAVEGRPQMIGPLQPIIAVPGDDVILPCHLEPGFNVERLTVEWSKPDLQSDPSEQLSHVEYVHLYRGQREDPDMKSPAYVNRTKLFTDEPDGLKRGNVSLMIKNVTPADGGRYRCFIPKLKSKVTDWVVELVVEPKYVKSWTPETPVHPNLQTPDPQEESGVKGGAADRSTVVSAVVVSVLLSLAVVGGVCLYKHKRLKLGFPKYDAASNDDTLST